MKIIEASIEDLGSIGRLVEREIRLKYANLVLDEIIESGKLEGESGLMFLAGIEASKPLFLIDPASPETAAKGALLFYDAVKKAAAQPIGDSITETMAAVMDDVLEAAEAIMDECDCPKCSENREAEGE